MSRPSYTAPVIASTEAWDANLTGNLTSLESVLGDPLPIARYPSDGVAVETDANLRTSLASAFDPTAFEHCVLWGFSTDVGAAMYYSNGTAWRLLLIPVET